MKEIEDIIIWPDGTWCYRHELVEYGWLGDDYIVLEYGTTRWNSFLKEVAKASVAKANVATSDVAKASKLQIVEKWFNSKEDTDKALGLLADYDVMMGIGESE